MVLCSPIINTRQQCQQTLDITIGEDEQAYFKVIGNYSISLTGNYVVRGNDIAPNDDYSEDEDSDYDLSPDEDELMNIVGADDSEDELDEVENPRITEIGSDEDVEAANGEEKKGEEKKGEEKKKLSKAEKKSLKRPADIEEGKNCRFYCFFRDKILTMIPTQKKKKSPSCQRNSSKN
jgi:FK506-binding nuclear protein